MKKNDTIFAIIWLVIGLPLIGLSRRQAPMTTRAEPMPLQN